MEGTENFCLLWIRYQGTNHVRYRKYLVTYVIDVSNVIINVSVGFLNERVYGLSNQRIWLFILFATKNIIFYFFSGFPEVCTCAYGRYTLKYMQLGDPEAIKREGWNSISALIYFHSSSSESCCLFPYANVLRRLIFTVRGPIVWKGQELRTKHAVNSFSNPWRQPVFKINYWQPPNMNISCIVYITLLKDLLQ